MLQVGVSLHFEMFTVCKNHIVQSQKSQQKFLLICQLITPLRSSFNLVESKSWKAPTLPAQYPRWPLCVSATPGKHVQQHQDRQAVPDLHEEPSCSICGGERFGLRNQVTPILARQFSKVGLQRCPQGVFLCTGHTQSWVKIMEPLSTSVSISAKLDQCPAWKCCLLCAVGVGETPAALTIGHSGHLVLQREDQLGLPSEVLAAALLVLQHGGDASGKVVQAVDHRGVCVGLWERPHTTPMQHMYSDRTHTEQKLKP